MSSAFMARINTVDIIPCQSMVDNMSAYCLSTEVQVHLLMTSNGGAETFVVSYVSSRSAENNINSVFVFAVSICH